jgi:penicillin-binding protein 2
MTRDASRLRIGLVGLVVLGLFAAMFTRLWYLQVLDDPKLQAAALNNEVRTVDVPAPRGEILDRNGTVIVQNQAEPVVTLSQQEARSDPAVIGRLAAVLQVSPSQIQSQLNNPNYSIYQPVPVQTNVSPEAEVYLSEHKDLFPGVSISEETQRSYPYGDTAAQVLGYVGQISSSQEAYLKGAGYKAGEQIGQSGVEQAYESYLRGVPGQTQYEVNSTGQVVKTLRQTPPRQGDDVQLSIDLGLQQEVEKDLGQEIQSIQGSRDSSNGATITAPDGAAVVLDPRNGQVLAMASYPSYDPSWWVGGISEAHYKALTSPTSHDPLLNRAIQGLYIPGSTFKIATATAALDSGLITPGTVVDDTGTFTIPGCSSGQQCSYHDADNEALGPVTVVQALAQSSDVFFYTMGYEFWAQRDHYGQTPIQDAANSYGLGEPTGIPLPGEYSGQVDSPSVRLKLHQENPAAFPNYTWFPGDNVEMAFGQGETQITPLQLANAYATFANGGTRWQPQIAADVVNPVSGAVLKTIGPQKSGQVNLPPSTREPMLAGFEGVTVDGTAAGPFAGFPQDQMQIAGKTGTASQLGPNGQPLEPTSLFASFAPATNPQYAIVAIIDQAGYGASAAAPVVRNIYNYLLTHPIGPVQPVKPAG